jgi:hypothetical protein
MKVAILRAHGYPDVVRAIAVPPGQSLDFDEGTASRRWLWDALGADWHLVGFCDLEELAAPAPAPAPAAASTSLPAPAPSPKEDNRPR